MSTVVRYQSGSNPIIPALVAQTKIPLRP